MTNVIFTLAYKDGSVIDLEYKPFDTEHSKLWLQGIQDFCNGDFPLHDNNRVYNFVDRKEELKIRIEKCNITIKKINQEFNESIPEIGQTNTQKNLNFVHTQFLENKTHQLYVQLNLDIHSVESVLDIKGKYRGQVFVGLPNQTTKPLPDESYKYFTLRQKFGYCYANYPHAGRHLYEIFCSKDTDVFDYNDHILPQHGICGNSYLYLGSSILDLFFRSYWGIRKIFKENNLEKRLAMKWGDPKLALGWLPVAKLVTAIDKKDLFGVVKLHSIRLTNK